MGKIKVLNKILIKRPIEEVYHFSIDHRHAHLWYHDLLLFEKLTEGDIRIGTEFRQKFRDIIFKEGIELMLKATEVQVPNLFASDVEHKFASAKSRSEFREDKEGTLITSVFSLDLKIPIFNVMSPFIEPTVKKKQLQTLKNLKAFMESEKHLPMIEKDKIKF